MEKGRKNNKLLKLSLLSISLILSSASAISVALPFMNSDFNDIGMATIESLVTLPSLSMLIFIFLSSFIIEKIGKRKTVILGLTTALIAGCIPAFIDNFLIIYISRFLLGAGIGIYNSLAISLISDYFEGEERQKMIGYQTAFAALGTSLTTFAAGILVNYHWQYAYLVYFISFPVLLLFYFGVPIKNDKKMDDNELAEKIEGKQSKTVNALVIFCCAVMFLMFIFVMTIFTKSGMAVFELDLTNQEFLGTALTIAGLVGAGAGFLYGKIYSRLKSFTPSISGFVIAISFLGLANALNMTLLTVYLSLIMLGFSLMIPYLYGILLPGAPEGSENLAVSLAMISCNLGSFVSPYVIDLLSSVFGNNSSIFVYQLCSVFFLLITCLFLTIALRKRKIVKV